MAIFLAGMQEQELFGKWTEYTVQGPWRMVSLAAYGDPEDPRYAAIWHYDPDHAPQRPVVRVPWDSVSQELASHYQEWGQLPISVSALYGAPDGGAAGANVSFSFIMEETSLPFAALDFRSAVEWEEVLDAVGADEDENGRPDKDLVGLDAVGFPDGSVAWTALLYPKTIASGLTSSFVADARNVSNLWEQHPDNAAVRRGWGVVDQVVASPYGAGGQRAVATLWRGDVFDEWPPDPTDGSFTGGTVVLGPIPISELQSGHDYLTGLGYYPHRVSVSGADDPWVTVVYARATRPLGRKFVVVDARDPDPPKWVGGQIRTASSKRFFEMLEQKRPYWGHAAAEVRAQKASPGWAKRRQIILTPDLEIELANDLPAGPAVEANRGRGLGALAGLGGDVYTVQGGGAFGSAPSYTGPAFAFPNRYKILDQWVYVRMQQSGARAAQVAVARGGKLVIWRAYTWAEPGYLVTHPTHLMGLGSIAKPLTGMAIAHLFFPDGEVSGLEMPLDVALGLENAYGPIRNRLAAVPLFRILQHQAGFPVDFDEYKVAVTGGDGALPALPGDTLEFVRNTQTSFFPKSPISMPYPSAYAYKYSGASVRVLGDRASQLLAPDGNSAKYEEQMRLWWGGSLGQLPPEKARLRPMSPKLCVDAGCVPGHSAVLALRNAPLANGQTRLLTPVYWQSASWAGPAGEWWMSAAMCARILGGMDPSAAVPELLNPAAVQAILGSMANASPYGAALFVSDSYYPVNGPIAAPAEGVRLWHNGQAFGATTVAGIDFPSASAMPQLLDPTTCIVYLENYDSPTTGAMDTAEIEHIRERVLEIEQQYGWEGDDLFAFV